jgi:predicted O-methyltransferase YrrM
MRVDGQIVASEARKLYELAGKVEGQQVIVEIGSFRGRSTVALALGALSGEGPRVFAVDPYVEFEGVLGGRFGPADRAALYENLAWAGVGHVVAVVSLPSAAAARAWDGSNIGLLWIDGDHRYEAVRADLEVWYPRVSPGGIVAFHDINVAGVERVIREATERGMLKSAGTLASMSWFEKAN